MPPERREHMRRTTLEVLPSLVVALHQFSLDLAEDDDDGLDVDKALDLEGDEGPQEPYVRAARKVGRNDPCPCGSGKKHKRCCL